MSTSGRRPRDRCPGPRRAKPQAQRAAEGARPSRNPAVHPSLIASSALPPHLSAGDRSAPPPLCFPPLILGKPSFSWLFFLVSVSFSTVYSKDIRRARALQRGSLTALRMLPARTPLRAHTAPSSIWRGHVTRQCPSVQVLASRGRQHHPRDPGRQGAGAGQWGADVMATSDSACSWEPKGQPCSVLVPRPLACPRPAQPRRVQAAAHLTPQALVSLPVAGFIIHGVCQNAWE